MTTKPLWAYLSTRRWKTIIGVISDLIPMTAGIVKITLEFRGGNSMIICHNPLVKD